jgi:hypothetical protein
MLPRFQDGQFRPGQLPQAKGTREFVQDKECWFGQELTEELLACTCLTPWTEQYSFDCDFECGFGFEWSFGYGFKRTCWRTFVLVRLVKVKC